MLMMMLLVTGITDAGQSTFSVVVITAIAANNYNYCYIGL